MTSTTAKPILLPPFQLFLCLAFFLVNVPAFALKIAEGTFKSKESAIAASGTFEVQAEAGKFSLVIKSDFKISEGPDLFFAFNPLLAAQVTGSNAKTLALKVDPGLKSLTGTQTYALPNDFDITKYPTLIVHCWKYDHLYATAVVTKTISTGIQLRFDAKRSLIVSRFGSSALRLTASGRRL